MIDAYKRCMIPVSTTVSSSLPCLVPKMNKETFQNNNKKINTKRTMKISMSSNVFVNKKDQFITFINKIRKFNKKIYTIIVTTIIVMSSRMKYAYANEGMNIYVYILCYVLLIILDE